MDHKYLISGSSDNKWSGLVLLGIVFLGAVLRLWGLDFQSLWNDELSSMSVGASGSFGSILNLLAKDPTNPPGYYVFLYFVEKFGDSEFILRLPSAICGTLSIGMIYVLGCRLYSWREGLISSALLSFLQCPIYFSQEARPYAILLLLSLVSFNLLFTIFEEVGSNKDASIRVCVAYVLVSVLSCYMHYYGAFIVFLQGVMMIALLYRNFKAVHCLGMVYLAILLAYLPWVVNVINVHLDWLPAPGGIAESFTGYIQMLFNYSPYLFLLAIVLYFFVLVRCFREIFAGHVKKDFFLLGWLILPFVAVFLISRFTSFHVMGYRYLTIFSPAAYLLFSRAIVLLPFGFFIKWIGLVVMSVSLLCHLIFGLHYYSRPTKEQFREAVGYIIQNDRFSTKSIVIGSVWNHDYLDYYFKKGKSNKRLSYILNYDRVSSFYSVEHSVSDYVWYIHMNVPCDYEFIGLMRKSMIEVMSKDFIGGKVYLFKRKSLAEGSV
ncbi:MAG: glycosyltransferase family 39 protein [Candidatus Omnitrophica bacterium]|nr:glycosyltransferase family 39 protein [Candidatus Omnitrophota bacterium]